MFSNRFLSELRGFCVWRVSGTALSKGKEDGGGMQQATRARIKLNKSLMRALKRMQHWLEFGNGFAPTRSTAGVLQVGWSPCLRSKWYSPNSVKEPAGVISP